MKVGFNFIQVPNFAGISNYAERRKLHFLVLCLTDSLQLIGLFVINRNQKFKNLVRSILWPPPPPLPSPLNDREHGPSN